MYEAMTASEQPTAMEENIDRRLLFAETFRR